MGGAEHRYIAEFAITDRLPGFVLLVLRHPQFGAILECENQQPASEYGQGDEAMTQ